MSFGFLWLPLGGVSFTATTGTAAGTGAASSVGTRVTHTVGQASGVGAASAVAGTTGIVSGVGTAAGAGSASAVGVPRQTISATGTAAGVGAANARADVRIWWGFGAEAFAAETFAGPQLADAQLPNNTGIGTAAGHGTAAAVSASLFTISAVGTATGIGTAAGTPISFGFWPATLPQCPLLNSWDETTQSNAIQFKPEVGPIKLRRKSTAKNWLSNVEFNMSSAQLATFKTFFETTLEDGTRSFVWPHPITKTSYRWSFIPKETPQMTRMAPGKHKVQFRLMRL